MKSKVYISGKISGMDYSVACSFFDNAEAFLIDEGFDTINPTKITHEHDLSWEMYMKTDVKAMMDCTHIYMLHNWEESRGAIIEHNLAKELGFVMMYNKLI